ncbi:hypothetical protein SETIT_4G101600v2 [Setaria italica]|uniref:Uncharacterized protein n=1 Tax=Setaria italica TaxID=4555 RepID=A0A368QSN8_SETIT|nr:hypothetical protein SETIT_4G101600v2 [Setaria italica]
MLISPAPVTGKCPPETACPIKSRAPLTPAPQPPHHTTPPRLIAMDAAGGGAVLAGGHDEADAAFFSRRGHRCCGCFWAPPWAASSSPSPSPRTRRAEQGGDQEWWHRVGEGGGGAASSGRRRWWRRGVDALMKVREWSELVAGPRWKTFIRRVPPQQPAPRGRGRRWRRWEAELRPAQLRAQLRRGPRRRQPRGRRLRGLPARLLRALRRAAAGLRQVLHGPRRPRRAAAVPPPGALAAPASCRRGEGLTSTRRAGVTVGCGCASLMGRRRR